MFAAACMAQVLVELTLPWRRIESVAAASAVAAAQVVDEGELFDYPETSSSHLDLVVFGITFALALL